MKALKTFLQKERKLLFIILAAAGIFLIFSSYISKNDNDTSSAASGNFENDELDIYGKNLEDKLKNTLCAVVGKDSLEVMITFSSTFENVYAKGLSQKDSDKGDSNQLLFTSSSAQNENTPVISKRNCPKISGVMIVCKNRISSKDCQTIKKAASTALNISESKIYIIGGEA